MFKKRAIPYVGFLLLVSLVCLLIVAAPLESGSVPSISHQQTRSTIPIQRRVQVVHVTLYDTGIYPQEARAYPGPVTISLEDLTGSSSGLTVARVDATGRRPVDVVRKTPNLLRKRTELVLPEGRYELADAMQPDNRAVLIIEP